MLAAAETLKSRLRLLDTALLLFAAHQGWGLPAVQAALLWTLYVAGNERGEELRASAAVAEALWGHWEMLLGRPGLS